MISFFKKRIKKDTKTIAFDFLAGAGTNRHGKHLADIWCYSDWMLEHDHAYIQWLFPLDTPSDHNSLAPVISRSDIDQLPPEKLTQIQGNMVHSLSVMLRFYGFRLLAPSCGNLIGRDHLHKKKHKWCVMHNHNHLRITRILKSLRLFKLDEFADAFYRALLDAEADEVIISCSEHDFIINPTTHRIWAQAVGKEDLSATKEECS